MELSKEQTQQIEEYLQKRKFNFIDLKDEILDHIISDIENLLNKNYSFEDAFSMVRIRWEKHFRETSSFYFGLQYSESKIVVKKAITIFKPFYFIYLAAYFLPIIFLKNFSIIFNENTLGFFNGFLNSITVLFLIYVVFIIIKVVKSKVKTTYSFILKTQYVGIIFLITPLLIGNHFNENRTLDTVFTGFLFGGFSVTYICHYFYKKHKQAIKKYKIS
jgi:hypothetical protein